MSAQFVAIAAIAMSLYAVRAVSPPGFRRSGVYFPSEAWTICEPTPEQLAEPCLICIPADGSVDFARRIGPLPILNEELLPEPVTNPGDPEIIGELRRQLALREGDVERLRTALEAAHERASELAGDEEAARVALAAKDARIAELETENLSIHAENVALRAEGEAASEADARGLPNTVELPSQATDAAREVSQEVTLPDLCETDNTIGDGEPTKGRTK